MIFTWKTIENQEFNDVFVCSMRTNKGRAFDVDGFR